MTLAPLSLPLRRVLLCLTCSLAAGAPQAGAQTLKDPTLEALYQAEKTDELLRVAQQRLATQADDAQAVLALALAALEDRKSVV